MHAVTAARSLTVCAGLLLAAACSKDPTIDERPLVIYSPRSCAVSQDEAFSVVYASGDFEASAERPPIASVFLRDLGRQLETLPAQARSLVVDISQRDVGWRGMTEIPASGPINILVWPSKQPCRLTRDVERRSKMTLSVIGKQFVVAGGASLGTSQVPHTFVGDLGTGAIERLPFGLNTRRAFPTITAFRSGGALVAGGEAPETGGALSDAEVYAPNENGQVGDFERDRIALSEPRTQHAAVVLSNGETLLVGGVGAAGPLRTMEIVDPVTKRARTAGVALLQIARRDPTVLRLANGEILVAGGVGPDGNEVPLLEWFAPDASRPTKRSVDLVTGRARSLVPLDAGGALAVIAPKDNNPNFKTVWVISADGSLEPGTPIDPATLDIVRLFKGPDGAPALWTGQRWLRWSPWLGQFESIAGAPSIGPKLDTIANGDSGLALWLDDHESESMMSVTGFRFAVRTQWDSVPKPLVVTGTDQLAPDRFVSRESEASALRFVPSLGLLMDEGASAFLTDVTFSDFDLEVDVTAAAPVIVLRSVSGEEFEVGGGACAFGQTATRKLGVKRRGTRVEVRSDEGAPRVCPSELQPGRVSLGLRGAQNVSASGARNLVVTRRMD